LGCWRGGLDGWVLLGFFSLLVFKGVCVGWFKIDTTIKMNPVRKGEETTVHYLFWYIMQAMHAISDSFREKGATGTFPTGTVPTGTVPLWKIKITGSSTLADVEAVIRDQDHCRNKFSRVEETLKEGYTTWKCTVKMPRAGAWDLNDLVDCMPDSYMLLHVSLDGKTILTDEISKEELV
jgi:hypothetical protein